MPLDEKTRARLEPLVLGRMARQTFDQISEMTRVPVRTLKRWAAGGDYAALFREVQQENRTFARARATLWADDVLGVLYQLAMTDGRSQLVRYHAAAKLADILGLGQDPADRADASGEELAELYAVLRAAKERARGDPAQYAPSAVGAAGTGADSLPYEAIELKRPVLPAPALVALGEEEAAVDAEFAERTERGEP